MNCCGAKRSSKRGDGRPQNYVDMLTCLLLPSAGNAKGLAGLIACFLPGGGRKAAAAANGKKMQ